MSTSNKVVTGIRSIIYLIAIIGVCAWAWKNFGPNSNKNSLMGNDEKTKSENILNQSEHLVVVTYFTSNQRCTTCKKIERLTHEAVTEAFSDQLSSKEIIFQTINFDHSENKHFVDDYQLAFKTVVVSEHKKGKETQWSKYDKVWELADQPDQFKSYLQNGIRDYLKEAEPTTPSPDA